MISSNFTLRFFIDDAAPLSHSSVYPQIHGLFSKLAYLLILILTLNDLNDKPVRQRYPFFICKGLYNVNYHICCLVGQIGNLVAGSAQRLTLKCRFPASQRVFLWFLPICRADSHRNFPRTQLAYSLWVPEPLLALSGQIICIKYEKIAIFHISGIYLGIKRLMTFI